jgi:hypothetical protein
MKHPIILSFLVATLIAGCLPEIVPYPATSSVDRSYALGVPRTAAPGETMITVRSMTNAPLYEVAFDYLPPQHDMFQGGLDYPHLKKGTRFIQVATMGDAIGLARYGYGVTRAPSITNRETYMPVTIWVKDGIVTGAMEGRRWTTDMLFLPVKATGGTIEAARMELVFDGVDGTIVSATHREYFAGPGTPSESRPVRFDIASNRTFTHEGLTIEVTSATPDALVFSVVDDTRFIWK